MQAVMQVGMPTGKQADSHTSKQSRQLCMQAVKQVSMPTGKQVGRHTSKQAGSYACRQSCR